MTLAFRGDAPPDILIEQAVDRAISAGFRLPRWGWPIPGPYNGANGRERIVAWQKVRVAQSLGMLEEEHHCGLCRSREAAHLHGEIYFRPLAVRAICRSCHFHIHKRFQRPDLWAAKLAEFTGAEAWVRSLRTVELSRSEALAISRQPDVFAVLAQPHQCSL